MKATAVSYPNIGILKYLGNTNDNLNLPSRPNISMGLSGLNVKATVEFGDYREDTFIMNGIKISAGRAKRILDYVRQLSNISHMARIVSVTNISRGLGIMPSAAFAAIAMAASRAAGLSLTDRQLSSLARLGHGSACRSINGGYVEWLTGKKHHSSYAKQLAPASHWDIRDLIVMLPHDVPQRIQPNARTSPLYSTVIETTKDFIKRLRAAIMKRDFETFGRIAEFDAMLMYHLMRTTKPPCVFWNKTTFDLIENVKRMRSSGIDAYSTADIGPSVHILTTQGSLSRVIKEIDVKFERIIHTKVGGGTECCDEHIF